MIERFNYYRHTRATGLTDDAAVDNLAIVARLIVFPETPSAVLTAGANSIRVGRSRAQATRNFKPMPDWKPRDGRFASLSDEAFATVSDILDAGARLFASSGYHNTSANMIIREAARSRGTFYKYFDGKLDLLVVLARECAEEVRELSDRLKGVGTSAELRVWLADFLALHQTHSGVFRVWLEQVIDDPAVRETSDVAVGSALGGMTRLLARVERAYPLDLGASALMFLALLERVPGRAGTGDEQPTDRLADTLTSVVERGFLNAGT
jgi:AcrR family transcriptional regulator